MPTRSRAGGEDERVGLFGSDLLFTINDPKEMLRTLGGRGQWSRIRADILEALIRNAAGDVLKVSRFVFVSEYFDCVKTQFVDLATVWKDPRLALSAFAATLVSIASDTIKHLGEHAAGSEQQAQAVLMVEIAYLSALLCDPYMLGAYRGLASFYRGTGKHEHAARTCRKFDETEQELLSAQDEYLREYRRTKYEPFAAALRADMDRLEAQLGLSR